MRNNRALLALAMAFTLLAGVVEAAATITIINADPAGQGFNDPTAADPVGGNTGTTLGQQRLIAYQAAADKWAATVNSQVPIRILATWEALGCSDSSAVLGLAGAAEVFRDFPNAPRARTWFSKAQANALAGVDQDPTSADIRAKFNINLGQPGCLTGTFFYLGLDGKNGDNPDLVSVLTHEFGHGLGFQTLTDGQTGAQAVGLPSIWDFFLLDTMTGKTWDQMTDGERVASAKRVGKLVWNGSNVNSAALSVLSWGTPNLLVTQPDSVAGSYLVGTATFGPALADPAVTGQVGTFVDTDPGMALACGPLSDTNAAAVAGKIALIDRGICSFVAKTANLQAAGAIGVIIADNAAGSPPPGLAGSDPTIQIPAVRISNADGVLLKTALADGSGSVMAALGINPLQPQGTDTAGRVLMYAPNPYQPGSSISHFDISGVPRQLMEPTFANISIHEVTPPNDLTYILLKEIGWP